MNVAKNQLIPFDSPDKEGDEKWYPGRDLMNFPHPFRCILISHPGCGKTAYIKNIILRADPEFDKILVLHHLAEHTREYDDVEHELINDYPTADMIDPNQKTLLILEDLNALHVSTKDKKKIDRLFGTISSHMSLSIVMTVQSLSTQTTPNIQRCCNIMVVWKLIGHDNLNRLGRKCSVNTDDFRAMFAHFDDIHDSLTIDMTKDSPARFRKNGYKKFSE